MATADPAPARIPFWAHQLAELLLGLVVMVEGVRRGGDHVVVPVVLGGAVVFSALVTRGPLAAWPHVSRRVHRIVDTVVVIVAAASPLALGVSGAVTIGAVELLALVVLWLVLRTSWAEPAPRVRRSIAAQTATTADGASARDATRAGDASSVAARRTGFVVGRARAVGPHRLGRAIGRARRRRDP